MLWRETKYYGKRVIETWVLEKEEREDSMPENETVNTIEFAPWMRGSFCSTNCLIPSEIDAVINRLATVTNSSITYLDGNDY